MRAIWKGAVSFGLVSVPVKVYAATGTNDVRFHQVHERDGGRIRYKRVCSVDGEEVPYPEIAKAYETADGEQVVLSDEDLSELPLSSSREIDVVEFVPSDQIDPVLFNKAYYLEPERTALKPYTLLREALAATDRVAVVKVALRQREALALLRVRDDVICLQTLLWPDEVREASFDVLSADVELRPQEQTMASSLVESLAGDFDPDAFTDGYAAAVTELVEAKISAGETRRPPAEGEDEGGGEGAQVVDLLSALQRSVDRAKRDRGEEAEAEPASAPRRSRRRAAQPDDAQPDDAQPDDAQPDDAQDAGQEPAGGSGEGARKPARRRRTTSGTSSTGAAGEASSPSDDDEAAAGPRRGGGRPKASSSKASSAKASSTGGKRSSSAPRGSAADDGEEAPKPARRTRKKSA